MGVAREMAVESAGLGGGTVFGLQPLIPGVTPSGVAPALPLAQQAVHGLWSQSMGQKPIEPEERGLLRRCVEGTPRGRTPAGVGVRVAGFFATGAYLQFAVGAALRALRALRALVLPRPFSSVCFGKKGAKTLK